MSDFFTEQLKVADENTCNAPWLGARKGKHFRCAFCGYKFVVGDRYRVVYTNDMRDAYGNPVVCEKCNAPTPELRERWKVKHATMNAPENWWFFRHEPQ